jgi:hypothetical protein
MRDAVLASLVMMAICALSGCGEQAEDDAQGSRGPVTVRWWDRQARAAQAPPTVLQAESLQQLDAEFKDLRLVPVLLRRPSPHGDMWIHAPAARLAATSGRPDALLDGPVHLTGTDRGVAIAGVASGAKLVRDGTWGSIRPAIELTDLRIARGGLVWSAPSATVADGRISATGPVHLHHGAPAMAALLGAVP